jgi:hypothetical protein
LYTDDLTSQDLLTEEDASSFQSSSQLPLVPTKPAVPEIHNSYEDEDEQYVHDLAQDQQEGAETHEWKDLYDEAYIKLRNEHLKIVDAYERGLLAAHSQLSTQPRLPLVARRAEGDNHREQIQRLVEDRLDALRKAKLKITVGGKDIVIKDHVTKLVRKVLAFTETISTAACVEPHAALAWAGVLIILPVSVVPDIGRNTIDIHSCLAVSVESSYTGGRCNERSSVHFRASSPFPSLGRFIPAFI